MSLFGNKNAAGPHKKRSDLVKSVKYGAAAGGLATGLVAIPHAVATGAFVNGVMKKFVKTSTAVRRKETLRAAAIGAIHGIKRNKKLLALTAGANTAAAYVYNKLKGRNDNRS